MSTGAIRAVGIARSLPGFLAAAALVLCGTPGAWASIDHGDAAELFVVVWDPVKEASYSLDLGLNVNDFKVNAQQDAGIQTFWKLDAATDPHLASFRALGTSPGSLRWAVLGFDGTNDSFGPGDLRGFVTLQQGPANGVRNPDYSKLVATANADWIGNNNVMATYVDVLSSQSVFDPVNSNHSPDGVVDNYAWNGSSFDAKGTPSYFGAESVGSSPATYSSQNIALTNSVGKSSWFYALTDSPSGDPTDPIVVDEFDNIAHDGYWGLAENPADGSLVLSYTLESALRTAAQHEFALRIGRSEFNGAFAVRRLGYVDPKAIPLNASDFTRLLVFDATAPDSLARVSAVPEAQGWMPMLAGLAALAAVVRRRLARR